ncbi:MAG: hypothetical protein ACYDHY_06930 [Acidiferrobacterales bacterium]
MKKELAYVASERFMEIASGLGLPTKEQAGFIQVVGPKGRRLYVAKTKMVGRVDIAGFEVADVHPGTVVKLGGLSFGQVKEQLDFDPKGTADDSPERLAREQEIVAAFAHICGHMATLAPVEKAKKGKAAKAPEQTEDEVKAARRRKALLLAEVAKKTGKALSKEAQELVNAELAE